MPITCKIVYKHDLHWDSILKIPKTVQYTGTIFSSQTVSYKLLIFRIFSSIYAIGILIWNFARYVDKSIAEYWFMFLTQWIAIIVTSYFITISIMHYIILKNLNNTDTNMQLNPPYNINTNKLIDKHFTTSTIHHYLSSIVSILLSICFSTSIAIVMVFWTTMVNYTKIKQNIDVHRMFNDIHIHGILLILLIIDYIISCLYIKYSNIFYSILFAFIYLLWTLLFYILQLTDFNNHPYIYKILNWTKPAISIPMCIAFLLTLIIINILLIWIKYKYILHRWIRKNIAKIQTSIDLPKNNKMPSGNSVKIEIVKHNQTGNNTDNTNHLSTHHALSTQIKDNDSNASTDGSANSTNNLKDNLSQLSLQPMEKVGSDSNSV